MCHVEVHAALEWLWSNAKKPAVATLSLGIRVGDWSQALQTAVHQTLLRGILVVVAAGAPPPFRLVPSCPCTSISAIACNSYVFKSCTVIYQWTIALCMTMRERV